MSHERTTNSDAPENIGRRMFIASFAAFSAAYASGVHSAKAQDATPFNRSFVIERARALAQADFVAPTPPVPDQLGALSYDDFQKISYRRDKRLFAEPSEQITVEFFHSGFIYTVPVEMFVVSGGTATKMAYSPDLFNFGDIGPPAPDQPLEFAGFRAQAALNKPGVFDEFVAFLGASYFRAVASGQAYGLSGRGLAIGISDPGGEEFPVFRSFWLEQPLDNRIVVHALMDSPSVAAAFRFVIQPGDTTVMDIEATLFARVEITHLGVAPLTSMYLYDAGNPNAFDDFRPSVHDSDGLAIWNGAREHLWRPLNNPRLLQVSVFDDEGPVGFGLIQRNRDFSEYEDLEAKYHKRPSLWVEPSGDWGKGAVVLVEIPTDQEIHDNINAFWRPDQPIASGSETNFTYRLIWGWDTPINASYSRVTRTLTGAGGESGWRRFVIDFTGDPAKAADMTFAITANDHAVKNAVLIPNVEEQGLRLAFEIEVGTDDAVDIRANLVLGTDVTSEVWIYRWTK